MPREWYLTLDRATLASFTPTDIQLIRPKQAGGPGSLYVVYILLRNGRKIGATPYPCHPSSNFMEMLPHEAEQVFGRAPWPSPDVGATASPPAPPPEPAPTPAPARAGRRPGRRGRTAEVNKIDVAVSELMCRIRDGRPISITALTRAASCTVKNLQRSSRFMNTYHMLVDTLDRLPRHRGRKVNGHLEAWAAPPDEDDEGN